MTTEKLKSIKGRVARITRLDDCGNPLPGEGNSIVTRGFITVSWGSEWESGEDYTQKNAWGELWINEQDDDILKWVNVKISFAEVDPDVLDVIGGGNPVLEGSNKIGATFGHSTAAPFAIEVWTKAAGANACLGATRKWGYTCIPFIRKGRIDGDLTIENGPMNIGFMGQGYEATDAWGRTPYNDNPLRASAGFPVGDFWGIVTTTVQPPDATAGAVELFDPGAIAPGDAFPANVEVTAQSAPEAATLVSLGYVVSAAETTAWSTGEYFSIGSYQFHWSGSAWAAGPA